MEEQRQYHQGLEVSPYQYTNSPAFDPNSVSHQSSGLEVVPEQYSGLHPVDQKLGDKAMMGNNAYQPYQQYPASAGGMTGSPYSTYGQDMEAMSPPAMSPPLKQEPVKNSRKKMWLIIGAAVAAVVIIAAVVGGVVGSRASHHSKSNSDTPSGSSGGGSSGGSDGDDSGGSPSGNSTSPSNTTEPVKDIRLNAKLAATGYYIDGDDFRIRLFYQGPEGYLRYSDYLSANDAWANPVVLDNLNAMNNTPVAGATWLSADPAQMYLFYVNEQSVLRSQLFQDNERPVKGDVGGLNEYRLTVDVSSRMAGFFPYVIAQDTDGLIRWIQWDAPNNWSNKTFTGIKGTDSTGMAFVPASVDYKDGGSFLYRNEEGKMSTFIGSQNGDVPSTWSWAFGAELAAPIPKASAIGAFVIGREADLIDTYALYQDDGGALQVMWQNDTTSGWQGPKTFDALAGADDGTDITCVTQTTWDMVGVNLKDSTVMSRCYFQSDGKVKEVRFDGTTWLDLGFLPIN